MFLFLLEIISVTSDILDENDCFNKYMLFTGWEVRIVKNCDRGLENQCPRPENAARGLWRL